MENYNDSMLDAYKELIGQIHVKDKYIESQKEMTFDEKVEVIRRYI